MIYTMKCEECQNEFDVLLLSGDEKPAICEECGGKLERIYKPFNVKYIGLGFPSRDYKIEREMKETEEIMKEPSTPSEIQVGKEMLAEREKEMGYEKGRLTGKQS